MGKLTEGIDSKYNPFCIMERRISEAQPAAPNAQEMAKYLGDFFSIELTALMTLRDPEDPDKKIDTGSVNQWTRGDLEPDPVAFGRLKAVYEIVKELVGMESAGIVIPWFMGMNPYLEDQSPAMMIAVDSQAVREAAQAFIAE